MNITLFQFPPAFVQFSVAVTAVVALSLWVNSELAPVMPSATTFLPIYLLMITVRVVFGLAFCGACVGIGMGSFASSIACFRYLNQKRSLRPSPSYSSSCFAAIVGTIVFFVMYGIGFFCIGATGPFPSFVMFVGLQVSEFLLLRRISLWRQAKGQVPV